MEPIGAEEKIKSPHERRCFCGGRLVTFTQFGRAIGHNNAQALSCEQCCYVSFDSPSEEELKEYYSTSYGKGSTEYYNIALDYAPNKAGSRADIAIGLASKYLRKKIDPVILELGCAFGGAVYELRKRGYRAFGIDLNSDAIGQGRRSGNEFVFDMTPAQFLESGKPRVDLIVSYHMLEHIPDTESYLRDVRKLLSPGAVLMFRVPNGAYLKPWLYGFDTWDWFAYPDHPHMFSPACIPGLAKVTGYEIVEVISSECGETERQIREWLPKNCRISPNIIGRLNRSKCLKELQFLLKNPQDDPTRLRTKIKRLLGMAGASRQRQIEAHIKRSPVEFVETTLARVRKSGTRSR